MLYVYYGSDTHKARAKVRATIDALRTKNKDAVYLRVYGDEFKEQNITELTLSQGLFKTTYLVFLDTVCTDAESTKKCEDALALFAESSHSFFLFFESCGEAFQKKVEQYATKITAFVAPPKKEMQYDGFAITDALFVRDGARAWKLLMQGFAQGRAAEETHGVLFWAAKSMVLAQSANSAEEAGLKPFVFSKARRATNHFAAHEARALMRRISCAQKTAYTQGVPLSLILEQTLLEL